MIAFIFPGQGSQKRGMGQDLFDVVEYSGIESQADAVVGYSIRQLCLQDPQNLLSDTRFTQPALYVVNALHYYKALAGGARPQFLAGHSLGEYNALLAANVFDFLTGLRLVQRRGELMSQARHGGMAAVVGLEPERIVTVLRDSGIGSIDIANYNSRSQVVISGPADDLSHAIDVFEKAGARMCIPLAVSAAFHSRYMADAARQFGEFLRPMSFATPEIPVIANASAEPYPTAGADAIKSLLVNQITQPVRWVQAMRYLLAHGVTQIKELGPGNVLTRLTQQIQQGA